MTTWTNFSREEFACQCGCNTNSIKDELIDVLQEIRSDTCVAMIVTSGYRCPKHPIEMAKAEPGAHTDGTEADIRVRGENAFKVARAAFAHPGITAIGVKQEGTVRYLHLGIGKAAPGRPRPRLWSY